MLWLKSRHGIFKKENNHVKIIRMYILIEICLERDILTIPVVQDHIERLSGDESRMRFI